MKWAGEWVCNVALVVAVVPSALFRLAEAMGVDVDRYLEGREHESAMRSRVNEVNTGYSGN